MRLEYKPPLSNKALHSPLNLVGTEASGTSVHMARSTVDNCLNPLHIGLPFTIGTSVGVGDLDAKSNALTAIITLRHSLHLQSIKKLTKTALFKRPDMIPKFTEKCKCFFRIFF